MSRVERGAGGCDCDLRLGERILEKFKVILAFFRLSLLRLELKDGRAWTPSPTRYAFGVPEGTT